MTSLIPALVARWNTNGECPELRYGPSSTYDLRAWDRLNRSVGTPPVDGRCNVPTTADGKLDTDVIPAALVDHVEVVTGGASASWGSDAVSGVVNVILKKDLTGFQADVQGGISDHGDNQEPKTSVAFGEPFADGRGHFTVAAEYSRTIRACCISRTAVGHAQEKWGYVQTPQYQMVPVTNARLSIASFGGLILSGPLAGMQFGPGGVLEPFRYGTNVGSSYMQGGDGGEYSPAMHQPWRFR